MNAPAALFVTGTDTGVGKTVVAAGIISLLKDAGVRVAGFKPVESGVVPGRRSDAQVLGEISHSPEAARLYRLAEPLAPAVAADIEKVSIDPPLIVERFRDLRGRFSIVIVEGVGGVLVPITWDYFVLDLIEDLDIPALIVARAGLGTINHTVLTYRALVERGIEVFGIVLNACPRNPGQADRMNPDAVKRLTGCSRVVMLPRIDGDDPVAIATRLKGALKELF